MGSYMEYYIAEIEGEGIYISNTDSKKQRSLCSCKPLQEWLYFY